MVCSWVKWLPEPVTLSFPIFNHTHRPEIRTMGIPPWADGERDCVCVCGRISTLSREGGSDFGPAVVVIVEVLASATNAQLQFDTPCRVNIHEQDSYSHS